MRRIPKSEIRNPKSVIRATLLLALSAFAVLSGYQIRLPGLHNDEAREAGLLAVQLVNGAPIDAFRGVGIGARTFPLMVQDYIGAFNVYLIAPFAALLGPGPESVRTTAVLIGLVTLLTTFGFVRAAFDARTALLATGLLAVQPSYLFWNRQGVLVASLTLTLTTALLWVGIVWARRGGWQFALLGGLLAGWGVYAKLLFVWVLGGIVGAVLLMNLPALWQYLQQGATLKLPLPCSLRRPRRRLVGEDADGSRGNSSKIKLWPRRPTLADLLAATAGIVLGLLPLLVYNALSGGTLFSIGANLTTSYYGVNNLDFAANLRGRWDQFRAVIAGRDHFWYLGGSTGNPLWEWALGLSTLVIIGRAVARRPYSRGALALALVLTLGLIQTVFTVSGLFPTHFAIFTPLWIAIVAVATKPILDFGFRISDFGGFRNPQSAAPLMASLVVSIGLIALAGRDLVVDVYYHQRLTASGGLGVHSDAIYRLVDELERREAQTVVALDWGFAPQVQQLTGNRIMPHEIFGYAWETDADFAARLAPLLAEPDALFVFHWPNETIFPRREAFDAEAAAAGYHVEQVAVISRRDGAPIYEILIVNR